MAWQPMILVPPELWENRSESPPPVKRIPKTKDHSYNKWTRVRMHQDPFSKTEKQKREPIPIPIIETESPKLKRKSIIGSAPMFKTEELESGSETDSLPVHSKYIQTY
jgi:hypothetical protein